MLKVPWIYIPISIIIFSIICYFIFKNYVNKLKSKIVIDMKELCNNYSIPSINPILNPKNFYKNNANAFLMLNLSVSSWSGCQTSLSKIPKFDLITTFKGYDNYGKVYRDIAALYYSSSMNMFILSFSGTMYLTEWMDDFDFTQTIPTFVSQSSGILVQKAHYIIYNSFRSDLLSAIKTKVNNDTIFISTGHSLGASLASICFLDISLNNIVQKRTLYSFASPRVGNVEFANAINNTQTAMRITNSEDIVTGIPLSINKDYIYDHFTSAFEFSLNLGNYKANHVNAYIEQLK